MTKAKSESEKKKIENVAAVPVVAGLKDKLLLLKDKSRNRRSSKQKL